VSGTIYDDTVGAGWSWFPYYQSSSSLAEADRGLGGSAATCLALAKGGGLAFECRECYREGGWWQ
jgi:hypothetical protein